MASKAMADRLAAKTAAVAGPEGGASGDVAGDVSAGGLGADESATTDHVTETPLGETAAAAPTKAEAEAVDAVAPKETTDDVAAKALKAKHALLEEKLALAREKAAERRAQSRVADERKAAKAEREAAAAERAKWEKIGKEGTYLDGLKAMGRDPRAEWEAMNKEAIEAGTPEAIARAEHAKLQREIDAKLTPLQQELEQLRRERAQFAQHSHEQNMGTALDREIADPSFSDLRIAYDRSELLAYVRDVDRNPQALIAAAREHGVRLTAPEKGFTMREILDVVKSAQDAHERAKQARRAAQVPAETTSATPPTVNGTAPRRNAGTAIGNDLASQRASAPAEVPGLSPKEKLRLRQQAEIRRSSG